MLGRIGCVVVFCCAFFFSIYLVLPQKDERKKRVHFLPCVSFFHQKIKAKQERKGKDLLYIEQILQKRQFTHEKWPLLSLQSHTKNPGLVYRESKEPHLIGVVAQKLIHSNPNEYYKGKMHNNVTLGWSAEFETWAFDFGAGYDVHFVWNEWNMETDTTNSITEQLSNGLIFEFSISF